MSQVLILDGTNAIRRRLATDSTLSHETLATQIVERVQRAITTLECQYCAVCFDDSNDNWRRERFPAYKAERPEVDTVAAMRACWRALQSAGLYCAFAKSFEADDLVASLVERVGKRGLVPVVLSSDNDLLQLVGPARVFQYSYAKGGPQYVERTSKYVVERFAVEPPRYAELVTLVGGKNGVPGLPGVGEKRAAKLLEQHPDFDSLLASDVVSVECRAQLRLALELHRLRSDAPLPLLTLAALKVPT